MTYYLKVPHVEPNDDMRQTSALPIQIPTDPIQKPKDLYVNTDNIIAL